MSYNTMMGQYYQQVTSHQYEKAISLVNKSKIIRKKRNKLLSNFENGRLYFLINDYKKSNEFLNAADDLLESNFKTGKDVAMSNLVNPMMETYRGEAFERLLIYFYKALNYSALGKTEDAIVEARRITLAADRLNQLEKNTNKYNKDAFSLNLQGMIYEMGGDINNAFISYRNAVNIYLEKNNAYYGVSIPEQLKKDLLRTASDIGFVEEKNRYETLFNQSYPVDNQENELILFMEEGGGPIKEETNFTIVYKNGNTYYSFYDQYGIYHSTLFQSPHIGIDYKKLSDIGIIRLALPTYRINNPNPTLLRISLNDSVYHSEVAQNINQLSLATLQERFLSDLAKAIIRYLTKHAAKKGSERISTAIAEKSSQHTSDSEAEKKKKEENAKKVGDAIGFFVEIANSVTEKADTRCWLSLPAYIHYIRIPLKDGHNKINIEYKGIKKTITVEGKKGIQMKAIQL